MTEETAVHRIQKDIITERLMLCFSSMNMCMTSTWPIKRKPLYMRLDISVCVIPYIIADEFVKDSMEYPVITHKIRDVLDKINAYEMVANNQHTYTIIPKSLRFILNIFTTEMLSLWDDHQIYKGVTNESNKSL